MTRVSGVMDVATPRDKLKGHYFTENGKEKGGGCDTGTEFTKDEFVPFLLDTPDSLPKIYLQSHIYIVEAVPRARHSAPHLSTNPTGGSPHVFCHP
jgi:hypothetical protein